MAYQNLLNVAKLNDGDPSIPLIEEIVKYVPELDIFPFKTISGTTYKASVRDGIPTVGFRDANGGVANSFSTFKLKQFETFIMSAVLQVDKAVALADQRGPDHLKALEAVGVATKVAQYVASQVWYGTGNDAKGFPGLKAQTVKGATTANGDAITVDATGSTSGTASSVYFVRFGSDDVSLIGGNGSTLQLDPWGEQLIEVTSGYWMNAFVSSLTSWMGLQVMTENSVRRILNLTTDSGKGLTDSLMQEAASSFPIGYKPDAIFMSRRSQRQLQASRSITGFASGNTRFNQPLLAQLPMDWEGIPIVATDAILNTDATE